MTMAEKQSRLVNPSSTLKRQSMLVNAMQEIGQKNEQRITGQFGRVAVIAMEGDKLNSGEMDFEFTCEGDDDVAANEAEIIIYNLSTDTAKQFQKDKKISITAGYQDDTGVIFSGVIVKVKDKFEGCDRITTINALDDVSRKEKKVDSISYAAGTKASYILKDLCGKVGLPVAVFAVQRDHTYKDAVTVDGDIISSIQQYAKVCGVSAYINKGQIYVRSLQEGDDIEFYVHMSTGLIGSPEEFEEEEENEEYTDMIKGVRFTMLLQHRITTAAKIKLESRNIWGHYRVRSWKFTFNESEATTKVEAIIDNNWQ